MAKQQPAAREQSTSERENDQEADPGTGQSGHEDEVARHEQELAAYLQERIKPGLNSGAIPLLARSIAKEIAHRERPHRASPDAEGEDEPSAEADEDAPGAEADDEPGAEGEGARDFEADMHEFQAQLGEEWIVSFSVHGEDAWLTAAKNDGSQHLEAQTAPVLRDAIEVLNEGGGRSS